MRSMELAAAAAAVLAGLWIGAAALHARASLPEKTVAARTDARKPVHAPPRTPNCFPDGTAGAAGSGLCPDGLRILSL